MEEGAKQSVVLYPSPGMGHLVSMVEFAKLFHRHGVSVTLLIVDPPYNTGATASFISHVSSAHPTISFHRLPPVTLPPNSSPNHEALAFDLLRLSNPNLLHYLKSSPASAVVIDIFCGSALDVAAELHLPCYCFYTSAAGVLAALMYFPTLHSQTSASFKELGSSPLHFPGLPPIPADHMPLPMLDRDDEAYKGFLYLANRFLEFRGIVVNTFSSLEPRALKAIATGLCVPGGAPIPPIYCIGPLIKSESGHPRSGEECLLWLDTQPRESVVFMCFGSIGLFSAEQLKEIAVGLERSGQRFLWVVRSPPSEETSKRFAAPPEPDLDALLPEGFVERTRERGMVVKSWAPQVAVLGHESVSGFVTHCGWNSTLEAICAGVPMIAWPLYAEQRWNKVFLVEEMKLAVGMEGYDKGLVRAEEVETRVRWLMESEEGRTLRERTKAAKEGAIAALKEGGSSRLAMEEWIEAAGLAEPKR